MRNGLKDLFSSLNLGEEQKVGIFESKGMQVKVCNVVKFIGS